MGFPGKIGPVLSYSTYYPASTRPADALLAKQLEDRAVFSLADTHVHGAYPAYLINHLRDQDMLFVTQSGDDELLAEARPDFIAINWYTTGVVGA